DNVFFRSCCSAATGFPDGIVRGVAYLTGPLFLVHPPGAVYSYARGYGMGGIVGRYDTAGGVSHGVVRAGPSPRGYETIDVPGAIATIANQGRAGEFIDRDGVTHGFVLTDGKFESVDFPGAAHTAVKSMETRRQFALCGSYIDAAGNEHGFVFRR